MELVGGPRGPDTSWLPQEPIVLAQHGDLRLTGKSDHSAAIITLECMGRDDIGTPCWRRVDDVEWIADGLMRILLRMIAEERERMASALAILVHDRDQEAGRS
ncbi:MAG TPA: hypothetical protein PK413_11580 [Thermoanaerobaculia bacterium]|nr:hypothetical protein [Thermoanaerobaculia bacterium]